MTVSTRNTLLAGAGFISIAIMGGMAYAGGGSGGMSPCSNGGCAPHTPPPAPMPGGGMGGPCCKGPKGPSVHIPGVHVAGPNVMVTGSNVVVNQGSIVTNTQSYLNTSIVGSSENNVIIAGGGGYYSAQGVAPTAIDRLNVSGGDETYMETVTEKIPTEEEYCEDKISIKTVMRAVQAVCIDDKGTPHPASRVDASDRVPPAYKGELFRCMAGTSMQVTLGSIDQGHASFAHGETFACRKGEALVHEHGGNLVCKIQAPERDCNERSLLRRHGPGIKYVEVRTKQKICVPKTRTVMKTVQRQVERTRTSEAQSMIFDGGVGQGVQ
ncbi:MAG: hypothetical protein NXH72_14940 [Hyphomonadaceae bacterium]|nr:hypothetical protein [Hyphomonadaceae bacterium]